MPNRTQLTMIKKALPPPFLLMCQADMMGDQPAGVLWTFLRKPAGILRAFL
jgi:hypothetical protein